VYINPTGLGAWGGNLGYEDGRLRLGVFERKILRRINGPMCEEDIWRSRYNDELHHLYGETDLVTAIKKTSLKKHFGTGIWHLNFSTPCM
jgi:hypothetical protein